MQHVKALSLKEVFFFSESPFLDMYMGYGLGAPKKKKKKD